MRIKAQYAHLRGRCPDCGLRVEPPQPPPSSLPLPVSDSDEPIGLVPIEEEWPEPAQLEAAEGPGLYSVSAGALDPFPQAPQASPPPFAPRVEGYSVATGPPEPAPLPEAIPVATPYVADQAPKRPPLPQEEAKIQEEMEMIRRTPPTPPADQALWAGIYSFPLRQASIGPWLLLSLSLGMLCLVAVVIAELQRNVGEFRIWAILGTALAGPVFLVLFARAGTSAANLFLTVLEQTAGGHDELALGEHPGMIESFSRLAYLFWVTGCAVVPLWLFWGLVLKEPPSQPIWWVLLLAPSAMLFVIMILSSLWSGFAWSVLNRQAIAALLGRPDLLIAASIQTLATFGASLALAYRALLGVSYVLAPIVGLVSGACVLIEARFLGRVAWVLSSEAARKGKRKRRREPDEMATPPASSPPPPAP
jgi:hypothetical protein